MVLDRTIVVSENQIVPDLILQSVDYTGALPRRTTRTLDVDTSNWYKHGNMVSLGDYEGMSIG